MSFWTQADGRREERGGGADEGHERQRVGRVFKQRRHSRTQEHAGRHHGRGVDQRGDRRGAFHRVGKPGVQANCADLPIAPMNSSRQIRLMASKTVAEKHGR